MKKLYLAVAMLLVGLAAVGQENDGIVYPNTFYGAFNLGANAYAHSGEMAFSAPSIGLTGGVWLASPLAFQIAVDAAVAPNAAGNSTLFMAIGGEFKWDVNSTFFHIYNKNFLSPIPFYPLVGMGLMEGIATDNQGSADRAFQMMLGLQAPMRVSEYMDAILQYKCFFLPQDFDNSRGDNFVHTLGIGLQFRQGADPYHRRTERYTRAMAEDWFFGLGIGPNYSAFDIITNPNRGGWKMVGISPDVMVGRNFSNFWTVRLVLSGLTAHEQYDTVIQDAGLAYRYSFLHADLMLNVSNLILRGRGVHFNAMPYLGAGPVWRYDHPRFDIAANAGVVMRYYLNRKSDIFLDLRYVMVSPAMGGGTGPSGKFFGVGLPSATIGYIYNFGHNTTRYRLPLNEVSR